jgi:signal transduction histidine kinase
VFRPDTQSLGTWLLVLSVGSSLLAVAVGSLLTARLIVGPLLLVEKELMANVAHELRTPLSRIRVALEIAGEGDLTTARASLEDIGVDLAELEALINDVLTASRLELTGERGHGGLPLNVRSLSAGELGADSAARFRTRHPERSLSVVIGEGVPSVNGDQMLLRRALDNLLENAAKYSGSTQPIALSVGVLERGVVFEVKDQGIGIAKRDLRRVFSPFFRAERSRTRSGGGVGLGLTLTKRIIEAHRGRIRLESSPGQGTTARIELPRARA